MRGALAMLLCFLAGCLATPSPSAGTPDLTLPAVTTVLLDKDLREPLTWGWGQGFWDPNATLDGAMRTTATGLDLTLGASPHAAIALVHGVHAAAGTSLVIETNVTLHGVHRFGVYVSSDHGWTGNELDAEGACLCAWQGPTEDISWYAPRVDAGVEYGLQLVVGPTGAANASLWKDGTLVASHDMTTTTASSDAQNVWIGVWRSDPFAASSATVHHVRVTQSATAAAP